jgi:hypothetical protein
MKELKRLDVQALSIINHERHKPALQRENQSPFRDVILENARQHNFGVMTTWDLYRLARGAGRNEWVPATLIPLFYQHARISPIPPHLLLVDTLHTGGGAVDPSRMKHASSTSTPSSVVPETIVSFINGNGRPVECKLRN